MTVYISRDFQMISGQTASKCLYLAAMFLRSVMNFSVVGQTNLNIDSHRLASGSSGSLNLGSTFEDHFMFPSGSYSAGLSDINKILVLKSVDNPKINSGLFRIIATGSFSGSTTLQVDYRSTDNPPIESGSLEWAVYNSETSFTVFTGDNGTPNVQYGTRGSASASRIIMQTPHSSSWQVRLCREADQDSSPFELGWTTQRTVTVGVGGDTSGDFPIRGEHNHMPMWNDTFDDNLDGSAPGWVGNNNGDWRLYFWGEDGEVTFGGGFVFFARTTLTIDSTNNHNWCAFGTCEDETYPLPPRTSQRLFSFGTRDIGNSATQGKPFWDTCINATITGGQALMCIGLRTNPSPEPVQGGTSLYTYARTNPASSDSQSTAHPIFRTQQADNEYLGATELVTVEVTSGVRLTSNIANEIRFRGEPRRLGRFPIARAGRQNFGQFTVTSDSDHSWIHLIEGIYLPWSGSNLP